MTKNSLLKVVALAAAGVVASWVLEAQDKMAATNAPISFRYVKTGEFNNRGYISYGTIFWATNHTTNIIGMHLAAVEVKAGTNWITRWSSQERIIIRLPGKASTQSLLNAHEAGYATIQLAIQPTGTVWRARVDVAKALGGGADAVARLRWYPTIVKDRFRTGNTNISLDLFDQRRTYFGQPSQVFSQEISDD
jgi:hypothetical protein